MVIKDEKNVNFTTDIGFCQATGMPTRQTTRKKKLSGMTTVLKDGREPCAPAPDLALSGI